MESNSFFGMVHVLDHGNKTEDRLVVATVVEGLGRNGVGVWD